ncbi:MAG: diguanylate cyclase (GGDEF)-like protein, partial [Enterobacterales bacterium]
MAKRLKISQVINSVEAGIIILDNDAKIFSWNKWISDATKIKLSDVKGKSLFDIFEEPISTRLTTAVADAIEQGQSTFLSHRLNKHPLPLYKKYITAEEKQNIHQKTSVSSLILDDGRCYCVISVTDVSASVEREDSLKQQTSELRKLSEQLKISEENTRFMAFHDALTKIPNRTLFYDRLNMAVSQTDRQENFLAVMLIDIDFFKEINDSYGHDTGDQFLVEIAQRLKDTLRRADTVSRLGGDEFAIVLTDQKSIDGIETIVQMLYNKLTAPMFLTDKNIKPSVSIGISLFPNDSTESYDLLKNADLALYNVKHHGRSGYRFYSSKMRSDLTLRQKQQDLLREALTDDRIVVYYQPIFGLSDNQIHSLEALVRYVDKNNELV